MTMSHKEHREHKETGPFVIFAFSVVKSLVFQPIRPIRFRAGMRKMQRKMHCKTTQDAGFSASQWEAGAWRNSVMGIRKTVLYI
jgi:hypothetical protein